MTLKIIETFICLFISGKLNQILTERGLITNPLLIKKNYSEFHHKSSSYKKNYSEFLIFFFLMSLLLLIPRTLNEIKLGTSFCRG